MTIRPATLPDDGDVVWAILEPTFRAGDTYGVARDMTREQALAWWFAPGNAVFLHEDGGTYYVRANYSGGGSHVANCGYVTAPTAQGRGIARAMCEHSLEEARRRGFRAMQFNFVVSTNDRAVRLWESLGFAIVGRLPGAFVHPIQGEVDVLVMFQRLAPAT